MANQQPAPDPIIVKKKIVHGGHHGGAWKVAYADFVTAMMALFIVLWLMSSSEQVKKAVAGYFQDPTGHTKHLMGAGMAGSGENLDLKKDRLDKLKETIEDAMKKAPELRKLKDQVQMTVTGEGLRIELVESETGTFFESGNATPTGSCVDMLKIIAGQLGKMDNRLLLEGHTDAKPYTGTKGYSNWELSSDRANSARRLMEENGLRAGQIAEIRGYADQHLRKPTDPDSASNRRISIVVKYKDNETEKFEDEQPTGEKPVAGKSEPSKSEPAKPESGKAQAEQSPTKPDPSKNLAKN